MFSRKIPTRPLAIMSREDLFDALIDLRGYGKIDPLGCYLSGKMDRDSANRLERELREQSGISDD